jgi:hypothetical protein
VLATLVIAALSVFVMPIVYLLGLRHDISSSIANIAYGIGGILVLTIVFGCKYFSMLKLPNSAPKVLDETQNSHTNTTLQLLSQDIIRSMKPDEQFEYYTRVIQKYTALRLQLNSGDNSSYNSQVEKSKQGQQSGVEEQGQGHRLGQSPQSLTGGQVPTPDDLALMNP